MNLNCMAAVSPALRIRGFSLLELMVALALGLLLSAGILTLFQGTSQTNKLQNGLARLQENGRFAATRMDNDLRMTGAQYCSNFTGGAAASTAVPVIALRAPMVFAEHLNLPDPGPDQAGSGIAAMNSLDASGYPAVADAAAAYPLSPRYFVQGYQCDGAGDCAANLPSTMPAQGVAAGDRAQGSDVLTVRYQRGSGWPIVSSPCSTGSTLTLNPGTNDDTLNIAAGDKVLVSDCQSPSILPVASVAGTNLTLDTVLTGSSPACQNPGNRDMRAFNFSKDFATISYYVGLREDDNPDARPNSGEPLRLVPVLIRRENGVEQELVRGVDEVKFSYGVQDNAGNTRFMTANEVDAGGALCPPAPPGVTTEPGCLWRAVRTIEAHLLVNTTDEVFGLDDASRAYTFMTNIEPVTDATVLPNGLNAGSMLRREFVIYASNRNYNF